MNTQVTKRTSKDIKEMTSGSRKYLDKVELAIGRYRTKLKNAETELGEAIMHASQEFVGGEEPSEPATQTGDAETNATAA
jgi:hypothetical protein